MRFEIELGSEQDNRPVLVKPLGEYRRGTWRKGNAPNVPAESELPAVIPGSRVILDEGQRTVTVFDALADVPERDAIIDAWFKAFNGHLAPQREVFRENLTDGDVKVWHDWIDIAVLHGVARVYDVSPRPAQPVPELKPKPEQVAEAKAQEALEPEQEPVAQPSVDVKAAE